MVSINGNLWSELGARAEEGELYLEPGVAQKCAQRCAELGAELDRIRRGAASLGRSDGLGHLPSGTALARKFEQKASGGEYPLDQALARIKAAGADVSSVRRTTARPQ